MKYPPLKLRVRLPSKVSSEFRVIQKLIDYTKKKNSVADFCEIFHCYTEVQADSGGRAA